ncbi:MAG TPA: DUF1549 domain-containing protein, partial [Gemmataceae bacterium]|nr:DUF1549 domain-containing protein [Gemmataceae bacterium]
MTSRRVACVCLLLGLLVLPASVAGGSFNSRVKRAPHHWAFQPVKRPALPTVHNKSWVRTPIDAFVLTQLEKHGLRPNPPADRRTLLRRVYLDLIGLPPTPAEQEAFVRDPSPNAYAKVVNDLLARPQYGERWARHWLDVARYAESNGYERDGAKPSAWRYRDYVIRAFNSDKPYDRFLTEQLAGDELPDSNAEMQIATTFLRLGTWDDEPADPLVDRCDQLDDVVGTTAAAFLGVTLRCARCHDHKFEPFSQVDYYRMLAVFQPLHRPQNDRTDLDRPVGTAAELAAHARAKAQLEQHKAALRQQLRELRRTLCRRVGVPPDGLGSMSRPGAAQGVVARLAAVVEAEIHEAETSAESLQRQRWEKQLALLERTRLKEPPHAYIWMENGPRAPVTHVLR